MKRIRLIFALTMVIVVGAANPLAKTARPVISTTGFGYYGADMPAYTSCLYIIQ
ncbi:MAG: hypothetical protein LAP85_22050 [Acidobacteriia bacterium]|nr:hypothetical protein [Terriglobia bacterium]